jgi:metal transporter CNNM
MPILLDKLVNEMMAIVISVTVLLFVGEIVPQALCTGPNQMKIASILSPFTYFLMIITYPISYPIALLMDFVIGIHGKNRFCNSDLRSLIELHTYDAMKQIDEDNNDEEEDNLQTKNNNDNEIKIEEGIEYKKIPENLDNKNEYGLSNEQAKYMVGVLDMTTKKVLDIMIPITDILMIDFDKPMTKEYLDSILIKGYSRIPIYKENKDNIIGILRMKKLIGVNLFENKSLNELKINLNPPLIIDKNFGVLNLLTEFTKGRSHMAFITEKEDVENLQKKFGLDRNNSLKDNSYFNIINSNINVNTKILGIVTLEDVIEKMFNVNILDEDDYNKIKYNKKKIKKMLTKQIAQSFIEKKKDKINEIITNSLTNNVLINEENPYKKIGETEEENKDFWV